MTVCFTDGGDVAKVGGIKKWSITEDLSPSGASPSRTGSYNLITSGSSQFNEHKVEAALEHATFIMGVAFIPVRAVSVGARNPLLVFKSDAGATSHLALVLNTDGSLSVYRGADSGGTLLGTTATGLVTAAGVYKYIEMKATLNDATGSVEVRVDETSVLTLTGVDTKNAGTKTVFDSFRLRIALVSGTSDGADDVYVCNGAGSTNNDFLGAVKIETLAPNGNGNSSQWVGSDGNSTDNYLLVDDLVLVDTGDYVEASATGNKDTYAHANSSQPTGNSVLAVVVHAMAYKGDAGARELGLVARAGGVESNVAANKALLNGTYQTVWGVFESKPGGGAWTVADVNSAEFGYAAT